jgi:capsular polysaccharide biosynthesis protein
MTIDYKQALVLALFLGLAIGVIIAVITEMYEEGVSTPAQMPPNSHIPSPPDVSALIEEARRITREAGNDT